MVAKSSQLFWQVIMSFLAIIPNHEMANDEEHTADHLAAVGDDLKRFHIPLRCICQKLARVVRVAPPLVQVVIGDAKPSRHRQDHLQYAEYRVEESDQRQAPLPSMNAFWRVSQQTPGQRRVPRPPAYSMSLSDKVAHEQHESASQMQTDTKKIGEGRLCHGHCCHDGQQHHARGWDKLPKCDPRHSATNDSIISNVHVAQLRWVPREEDKQGAYKAEREEDLACRLRGVVHHLAHRGGEVPPARWKGLAEDVLLARGLLQNEAYSKGEEETEQARNRTYEQHLGGALAVHRLCERRTLIEPLQDRLNLPSPLGLRIDAPSRLVPLGHTRQVRQLR
mmetsp:Transcript_7614/g.19424  ORF Transcript_7614/g.19424 Transcript_7614/m.19424 type:complete len:336 (+) Transcript_7614:225-1232(+)